MLNTVQEWSHVRRILSAGENTLIKQDSCDLSFVKHGIDLAMFFVLLPGVVDRSEFTSEYSLLLVVRI